MSASRTTCLSWDSYQQGTQTVRCPVILDLKRIPIATGECFAPDDAVGRAKAIEWAKAACVKHDCDFIDPDDAAAEGCGN